MKPRTKKIMIADDDPNIVDAIELMLEFEGYQVSSTIDGSTVLDMKTELPDLLLLDIWMAGEDGRNICKKLKHEPLTRHIPILMVSANKNVQELAIEAGADDFLAKPFQMNDLLNKIKNLTN